VGNPSVRFNLSVKRMESGLFFWITRNEVRGACVGREGKVRRTERESKKEGEGEREEEAARKGREERGERREERREEGLTSSSEM
jgi:hypothetical protein